jgi:hypothetical protein
MSLHFGGNSSGGRPDVSLDAATAVRAATAAISGTSLLCSIACAPHSSASMLAAILR